MGDAEAMAGRMRMEELGENWQRIERLLDAALGSGRHAAIASVNPDGTPHLTPIGFLFLRGCGNGFYFDEYGSHLRRNLETNRSVCVMLVDGRRSFWLRFLLSGRFQSPTGVRLIGTAGDRRLATSDEKSLLEARVGWKGRSRGGKLIWGNLNHVRDIAFERFEPVSYPGLIDRLWGGL